MTVDIQESLMTALYTLLTTDSDLQTAMGGTVRMYPVWAKPDATFPYLVHRIDMGTGNDWDPVMPCTYYLDIWSDSPSAEEALDIRKLIMGLLDNLESSTNETTDYFLWRQTDGFVPETEQDIWHYACQFNLKWLNAANQGVQLRR